MTGADRLGLICSISVKRDGGIREGSNSSECEAAEAEKRMLIFNRAASKFPFNVSTDLASVAP